MRRRRRIPIAIVWVVGVLVAGGAMNLFLALRPATLEAHVRMELSKYLRAPFAFSSFDLSWTRGGEIHNLRVFAPPAAGGGVSGGLSSPGSGVDPAAAIAETELFSAPSVRIVPRLLALLGGRFEIREVIIDSPRMRLARDRDGRWTFDGAVASAAPPEAGSVSPRDAWQALSLLPAVRVESGRFLYSDERTFREPVSETLEDVYADLSRAADGSLHLKAQLRVPFARKIELKGSVETSPNGPVVRCDVLASKIDLSVSRDAYLPAAFAEEARKLQLKGYLDVAGSFKWDSKDGLVPISASADVLRAELIPPCSPHPLKGIKGKVLFSERSIEAVGFEGVLGSGKVAFSSKVDFAGPWLLVDGPTPAVAWSLQCGLDSFLVDHRLREALPPNVRAIFEEYKVDGKVGANVRVTDSRTFPPLRDEISATVHFDGVDFIYKKFPYLISDLRGEVLIQRGRVSFERPIEGRDGQIEISVSGRGAALSEDGDINIVIKPRHVPIDEKFRKALPPEVHGIWDDFQLLGSGDAVIEIVREKSTAPAGFGAAINKPRVLVSAYPNGARMSYRHFPYEISGITGTVRFDTGTQRLTLDGLKGRHGGQEITGLGVVDIDVMPPGDADASRGPRTLYEIDIHSDDVAVDDDLVAALTDEGRRLLADFNFKGRVKTDVSIHSIDGLHSELKVGVDLIQGSVRHRDFRFPLDLSSGRLEILGNQTLVFTDVSTPDQAKPHVVFNGTLTAKERERTLAFNVDLKDLKFDDKFVDALPRPLSSFVTSIKLGGTYRGRVEGTYTFDESDPTRAKILYQAKDVSADEASVDFGVAIHDMVAKGSFAGGMEPNRPHHLLGEVQVDSAWFNRLHLTKGEIDFSIGEEHAAIRMARNGEKVQGRNYLPPAAMLERLTESKVKETFQMLVHSPDLYGGTVDGFVYVDTGTERDMAGNFVGGGFSMARAAEDVFGAKGTGTTGTASGKIDFTGKTGDFLALKGKGEGMIENGRLVELPLFLGILSLILGESSSRHYFNEVLLKYEIADGKFVARSSDGIDIRSTGLKLLGGGTMDFSGNLDLTLEPRVLDFKIPVVEELFSLLKKGLARVRVTGDLAKPKVCFATAAGLLEFGIDSDSRPKSSPVLPADLRKDEASKDLPPGPK